jgi:WD40 repeat protein/tRNA A-37 threonylcarbamoyl transferase component Bud32
MKMPSFTANCARCGTPLDSRTLNGLCPRCVALDFFTPASPDEASDEISLPGEGERRIGDYELLEEIARGGMGVVYRARQLSLRREVAVKMLLHGVLAGDMAIARFKAEAAAVANLRHPNIVAIHEIGEYQGQHFFSMEFVTGSTLADKVREGPLPAKLAATYLQRVAEAVHHAQGHGVLHRDLKPSNVLVDENDQPRVTDFGLAKRTGAETDLTMTGQLIGTPAYMSPEQAGGTKFGPVDARSDVYSLGAVLYHLVTGRAPFTGETITEILHQVTDTEPVAPRLLNPKLPRDLETICLECLAKEPPGRYASAQALADDLGRFLRGETISAHPAGVVEKTLRWCRRKPALATALGACVAILFAGVTGILWQLKQTESARRQAVQNAKDEAAQRQLAEQAQKKAEASDLVTRQNLYAADMLEVQRAVERNDFGTARSLLDAHRPKAGQADLRGFEWRYQWERSRGDDCIVLTHCSRGLSGLEFSRDGKWLAYDGGETFVCDTATWRVRAQTEIHNAASLAFFPHAASLAVSTWGPWSVKRWDWQQSGEARDFINSDATWPCVAASPAGDFVAVSYGGGPNAAEQTGTTEIFDAVSGGRQRSLPESGGRAVFSTDGKLLATGSWKGKIKLWHPATGGLIRELTNANAAVAMTFSPDGRTLAVCAPLTDGTWLYDVATGAQRPFARGNFCCVWGADFSPDGTMLATAVTDGTVRVWDVKSGLETACFRGHRGAVGLVAWSPDGKAVASGGTDSTVRIWNVATATNKEARPASIAGEVKRRFFSRDGKMAAMTESNNEISFREWPSLRVIGTAHEIGRPLGFLPDASAFVSIRWPANSNVAEVVCWSVPDFALVKQTTLSQAVSPGTVCQLSPDGHKLATGGNPNEVRVFDLDNHGKLSAQTSESEQDDGYVTGLIFSPDNRLIAVGFGRSTPVYLWDMTPTNQLFPLKGHDAPVNGLAFSPDGTTLFSGGGNLKSWDVAGRREQIAFPSLAGLNAPSGMDLSPDGKTLATTVGWEVQLWNMVTRREMARFETTANVGAVSFAPDGSALFITEQRTNGPVTLIQRAASFAETDAPGAP